LKKKLQTNWTEISVKKHKAAFRCGFFVWV